MILLSPYGLRASFQNIHIGDKLPLISGKNVVSDNKISTDKLLQSDKIIVISFWAEWSNRSVKELQFLQELSTQPKCSSINIITIYTGQYDNFHLNEFIKKSKVTLPVLYDNKHMLSNSFGLIAVPSTIITDKQGTIKYLSSGFSLTARDTLMDSIDGLLGISKKKTIPVPDDRYKPNKKALHFYNAAFKLFRQKSYEQALTNLEKAQSYDSLYLQPYQLQSVILFKAKKYDKAMLICQKLLQLDSTLISPQLLLSKNFIRNNMFDDAIVSLNKIIEINSNHLDARFLLVECYTELHKKNEASQHLDFIFSQYSNHPKAFYLQGMLHASSQNKESAIQSFISAGKIIFP